MATKSNKQIKEAKEMYDKITSDKELMSLIIAAEMDEMDEKSRIARAKREGREEGLVEGIEQGIEKGMQQGMAEGKKKEKLETAKKMLELGAEVDFIEKTTGLTKEEIEKLK